jgi:hypothetical protein
MTYSKSSPIRVHLVVLVVFKQMLHFNSGEKDETLMQVANGGVSTISEQSMKGSSRTTHRIT